MPDVSQLRMKHWPSWVAVGVLGPPLLVLNFVYLTQTLGALLVIANIVYGATILRLAMSARGKARPNVRDIWGLFLLLIVAFGIFLAMRETGHLPH